MIDVITNPEVLSPLMLVAGALVARFIPGWVPVFGIAKKVIEELVELHRRNQIPNEDIKKEAEKAGLKNAAKLVEKL
jgi:hypothetical protein